MDKSLNKKINNAKELLAENGYLTLKLGKGQILLARECELDNFKCDNSNCGDCINRRCLKDIIKEQIKL